MLDTCNTPDAAGHEQQKLPIDDQDSHEEEEEDIQANATALLEDLMTVDSEDNPEMPILGDRGSMLDGMDTLDVVAAAAAAAVEDTFRLLH